MIPVPSTDGRRDRLRVALYSGLLIRHDAISGSLGSKLDLLDRWREQGLPVEAVAFVQSTDRARPGVVVTPTAASVLTRPAFASADLHVFEFGIHYALFDLAFVVRSEDGLRKMQGILGGLRERYARVAIDDKGAIFNTDLMETVELGFLLDCADALVASALARDESRGGHYREDHPIRDDANWLKHTLATRRDDGDIALDYKPVKMGPYVPMERKY